MAVLFTISGSFFEPRGCQPAVRIPLFARGAPMAKLSRLAIAATLIGAPQPIYVVPQR